MTAQTSTRSRADVNRANSQHSTGPTTSIGKARSAQNSFKHGLYSKQLILPGEDPAEFDELRASLRDEHQPANTTEEILVDELAQSFWRMRRFRVLEARGWEPQNLNNWVDSGLMTLIARSLASAERSFHKSLVALQRLQKTRGFVPSDSVGQTIGLGRLPSAEHSDQDETGFVPSKSFENAADRPNSAGFVPQKTAAEQELFEYFGYYPEDTEKYVESILDSGDYLPEDIKNVA